MKKTVSPRVAEFCETGARMAAKIGVANVTRRAIAEAHNVTDPLVGKHIPGGKAALHKGIRKSMKELGLTEPDKDTIATKGKELRARKGAAPAKKVVAKKSPAKKSAPVSPAPAKSAGKSAAKKAPAKKVATPKVKKKVDEKPKQTKDKVKAPSNKAFPTKTPPLPTIPAAE